MKNLAKLVRKIRKGIADNPKLIGALSAAAIAAAAAYGLPPEYSQPLIEAFIDGLFGF